MRRARDPRPGEEVRLRVPVLLPDDASLVLDWRFALRETMRPLLQSGYRWTGADRNGTYVLTAP
ncbi:hypothetical protein U9R90_18900 [Streptomyces sp. E11-3]|uniref:hypothetical protein n=1 Tax=Streptomyces sp. E11-3 TaxID=3110112 RepID=UPI00398031D8